MSPAYEIALRESMDIIDSLDKECKNEMESWGNVDYSELEKSPSSLDAWDYCFSLAIGMACATITTSEQLEEFLAEIHHAASGASGDYSKLQVFLGKLLHHQGDAIDKIESQKHFINRQFAPADVGYHRLLWGHDIFDLGDDNPFKLMINQQHGLSGILQAVRHLLADTCSKQGLPLPGSSYLDYDNEETGKVSNYLIKISKELSKESVGNMRNANQIFSHMFTVRAEDITGGGAIAGFDALYFKVRNVVDDVRKVQFRLISYTVAFLGEAIIGAMRQSGVPYINPNLASAMFKNLIQLYCCSLIETRQLGKHTAALIERNNELELEVYKTQEKMFPGYSNAEGYLSELSRSQHSVDSLIIAFEET